MLVNQLVEHDICKVIIGQTKGWKQEINIGTRNNQNFVQIPFTKLKQMISYKAKRHGIEVIFREESYTSKASFLSNDPIPTYGDSDIPEFSGQRVKRGLYRDKWHGIINSDVNGAANILRKEVGNVFTNPIEVCSTPSVITAKFN